MIPFELLKHNVDANAKWVADNHENVALESVEYKQNPEEPCCYHIDVKWKLDLPKDFFLAYTNQLGIAAMSTLGLDLCLQNDVETPKAVGYYFEQVCRSLDVVLENYANWKRKVVGVV